MQQSELVGALEEVRVLKCMVVSSRAPRTPQTMIFAISLILGLGIGTRM